MKKHRKKKHSSGMERSMRTLLLATGGFILFLLIGYIAAVIYFQTHFLPQTKLNHLSVDRLNVTAAQNKLKKEASSYLLTIFDRDQNKYHISASEINYKYTQSDSVKKALEKQNSFAWIIALFHAQNITVESNHSFDADLLKSTVLALPCFNASNIKEPTDASIQKTKTGYEIVPETKGNHLIADNVVSKINDAVSKGDVKLTLTDDDYVAPNVTSTNEKLTNCINQINKYLSTEVTYDIADNNEVLDKNTILNWITVGNDYSVSIDEKKVTSYVQTLASKYNTYGDVRDFKTTKGDTLSFGGGDYGWIIDKEKEKAEIMTDLSNGTAIKREPIYTQRALYRTKNDIGNTYVEIDYTNQHLWYYKDGALVTECDVVTGKIANGNGSPDGFYKIVYKQSPATLVGEDYQSAVTYFMPFAYNIGLHDASWRNSFGGTTYINQGSHGCVNCPLDVVKTIYENISVGTPVVAYYRNPVTLSSNADKISNAYSYVAPVTTTPATGTATGTTATTGTATPATTTPATPAQ